MKRDITEAKLDKVIGLTDDMTNEVDVERVVYDESVNEKNNWRVVSNTAPETLTDDTWRLSSSRPVWDGMPPSKVVFLAGNGGGQSRQPSLMEINRASLAQREGKSMIYGATLGWGPKKESLFVENNVDSSLRGFEWPRIGFISSVANDLLDNGVISASLAWGNGWSGVSLELSYNKNDGWNAFAGYGRAWGASFTVVAGTSIGHSSGVMTSTFFSAGNGVVGATTNINAGTGGVEYFSGLGYGLGWAVGNTTGYQFNLNDIFSRNKGN